MKFAKLKKSNEIGYWYGENNDTRLQSISSLFLECSSMDWLKRRLEDPQSRGITGNSVRVQIQGNKVCIEPSLTDEPEEYRIEVDRVVLLELINKWEELTAQKVEEIVIIEDENCVITMTGK